MPPNTQATVRIPADDLSQVTESGQLLGQVTGVTSGQEQDHRVAIEVGAGRHDFVSLTCGALLAWPDHQRG